MKNFAWKQLWPDARLFGERLVVGLLIVAAFWLGGRILSLLIFRVHHRMPHNAGLLQLLGQAGKIAMVVFGIATALVLRPGDSVPSGNRLLTRAAPIGAATVRPKF